MKAATIISCCKAAVRTGAWNVASTSGVDFSRWDGSEAQKRGIREVIEVSRRYWGLRPAVERSGRPGAREALDRARKMILEAETSCFLFWGDSWVPKVYERTRPARDLLAQAEAAAGEN